MKTEKEIETLEGTYGTSKILLSLFSKYKNYDSTLFEHYDPNTLFANRKRVNTSSTTENTSVSIIEYKDSTFKRLLYKIKNLFRK